MLEIAALLPAVLAYGALALRRLGLPGLYYDEAADAVPAMQLVLGQPVELFRQTGIELFGLTLPLVAFDYVGAVHTYAAVPFFALLGPSTLSLRLMTITGGLLTVVATYAWLRWLFDSRWVAGAAALLLATQPSFVFFTRQGVHVSSLMALWAMLALLTLLAWHRSGRSDWLFAAAFLLGTGLATKILFAWFVGALVVVFVVLQVYRLRTGVSRPRVTRTIPIATSALIAFLAGCWPLLLFNLKTGGTLTTVLNNAPVSAYGVENAAYLPNLLTRIDNLRSLLAGDSFWYLGGPFSNIVYPLVFVIGLIVLLTTIAMGVHRSLRLAQGTTASLASAYLPGAALLVSLTGLVFLQSPFTLSGLWPTHLFILLPLLNGILALGIYLPLRTHFSQRGVMAATGVVFFLTMSNVFVDIQYHEALAETGGRRGFSEASTRLASYLDESGQFQPVAMDWGMKFNLQLLTQGRVSPLEVFGYTAEPDPSLRAWLADDFSSRPDRLYLFHGTDDYVIYRRFDMFKEAARAAGKMPRLETTITERDGAPLYLVYSVR